MELIKYKNNIHKDDWDQYVLNSNNGTIFHLRKFISYHEDRTFQDSSLIFSENNQFIALFTGAITQNCLHSHPGASFGGFVYNHISYKACQQIINLLLKYTEENNLNKIIIVPPPFIYYQKYNEAMEYCLGINKFKTTEYYISSFVELNQDPIKLIHNRKKRYINKLKDAVEIKESNDLDTFYPILLDNKSRHNVKPTHSLSELKILMNSFPNKIKLLLSYKNKIVIGGSLMFITNDNSCILFYNMIDYKYQDLQVASLQIYESLIWAKKNKIQFFDIGVSQLYENDKIVPHESLINFKEQFGAQAMIRKVMERNF